MRKILTVLMCVIAFSVQSQQSRSTHDDATSLTGDPSTGALVLPANCPSANPGDRCYTPPGETPPATVSAVPNCSQNQSYCNKSDVMIGGQCSAYFNAFSVQPSAGSIADYRFNWSMNTNDNYSLANAYNSYSMSINAARSGLGTSYATVYLTTTKITDGSQNQFSWRLSLTCQTR